MLDAFIIEEIKRRDRSQSVEDRPAIELPLPQPAEPSHHDDDAPRDRDRDRGVIIIDLAG